MDMLCFLADFCYDMAAMAMLFSWDGKCATGSQPIPNYTNDSNCAME